LEKSFVLNNNGEINIVPCSKSEVFKSKNISLVEKRYLMKFLDAFLKPNEGDLIELEEYSEKSLLSYLEHKNLSENLKSYILYCIALLNEEQTEENNITTKDGLNLVKRYLKSIEMYGLSPFLYCLYGTGDISQAFCRASAVYGGIFILDKSISDINVDINNVYTGIVYSQGKTINSTYLISNSDHIYSFVESEEGAVSKCVCFTDKSITATNNFLFLIVPPNTIGNKYSISIFQVDSSLKVVPPGKFIIYMSTKYTPNAYETFSKIIDMLFSNLQEVTDKPNLLSSSFYTEYKRKLKPNAPKKFVHGKRSR